MNSPSSRVHEHIIGRMLDKDSDPDLHRLDLRPIRAWQDFNVV